jgi:hypothetical protein
MGILHNLWLVVSACGGGAMGLFGRDSSKDIEYCKDYMNFRLAQCHQKLFQGESASELVGVSILYDAVLEFCRSYLNFILEHPVIVAQLKKCKIADEQHAFYALLTVLGECLWWTVTLGLDEHPKILEYLKMDDGIQFCNGLGKTLWDDETALSTSFNLSTFYFVNRWDDARRRTIPAPNGVGTIWSKAVPTGTGGEILCARLGNEVLSSLYTFLLCISDGNFSIQSWNNTKAEIEIVPRLIDKYVAFMKSLPNRLLD